MRQTQNVNVIADWRVKSDKGHNARGMRGISARATGYRKSDFTSSRRSPRRLVPGKALILPALWLWEAILAVARRKLLS